MNLFKKGNESIPLRKKNETTGKSEYAGSRVRAGKNNPTAASKPDTKINSILPGNPDVSNIRIEGIDKAYEILNRRRKNPNIESDILENIPYSLLITIPTPECWYCQKSGSLTVSAKSYSKFQNGTLVQEVFPDLSAPLREQLKTGVHPECWNNMLNPNKQ